MTEPRTRRAFLEALISGAAGLTLAPPVFGQGRGPAPITATKLTDRIAVLSGAGGNVGVLIGNEGLLMIDGGLANRAMDRPNPIRPLGMVRTGVVVYKSGVGEVADAGHVTTLSGDSR